MRELIHNDDMAAVMISESTVDAERPMEEEGILMSSISLVICIMHCWNGTGSHA